MVVPDSYNTFCSNTSKEIQIGMNDESKGYKLYDPSTKRVIINRDVIFEKDNHLKWNENHEKDTTAELDWGED